MSGNHRNKVLPCAMSGNHRNKVLPYAMSGNHMKSLGYIYVLQCKSIRTHMDGIFDMNLQGDQVGGPSGRLYIPSMRA